MRTIFDVADSLEEVRVDGHVEAFAEQQYKDAIQEDDAVVPDYSETIDSIDAVLAGGNTERQRENIRRLQNLSTFGLNPNDVIATTLRQCTEQVFFMRGDVPEEAADQLRACQRALKTMQEAYEFLEAEGLVEMRQPST